ncbi:hypothetical protein ROSEINA2194_01829 [Roseburia inulinivorans DSM 16841]|uniref:Uncharacterized protein n=1 Tax=Roseburia inulinivorans DSM 16841 TaxID=622312 RepID=C0FSW3_9FIRM|nr:hypothetical protein ROSEINA2194_01829 [Roseburia inulinivorans DSM 16841]
MDVEKALEVKLFLFCIREIPSGGVVRATGSCFLCMKCVQTTLQKFAS